MERGVLLLCWPNLANWGPLNVTAKYFKGVTFINLPDHRNEEDRQGVEGGARRLLLLAPALVLGGAEVGAEGDVWG